MAESIIIPISQMGKCKKQNTKITCFPTALWPLRNALMERSALKLELELCLLISRLES